MRAVLAAEGEEEVIRATNALLLPADRLALLLDAEGIAYVREYKFHPTRRFRADFFCPGETKVLVEVEGGTFMPKSRHTMGKGFSEDCFKYAEALCLGFVVLRVTPSQIDDGLALGWLKKLLQN